MVEKEGQVSGASPTKAKRIGIGKKTLVLYLFNSMESTSLCCLARHVCPPSNASVSRRRRRRSRCSSTDWTLKCLGYSE